MPSIEENAFRILRFLAERPRNDTTPYEVDGTILAEATGLTADEINDAVAFLVDSGLAEWVRVMGTAPYDFGGVRITPRGRYESQRSLQPVPLAVPQVAATVRPPTPVGSPYGFTDQDWEVVAERHAATDVLHVVFGYKFESEHYDPGRLKTNVEQMFRVAVHDYNREPGHVSVTLKFRSLGAGYGEHLFNGIARDIIASDIAVFETSDLAPNVMLEMGVALTWGVRVLPIKKEGCPRPPSDVSGQTWADYGDSASAFVDPAHRRKLLRMVEHALRKRGGHRSHRHAYASGATLAAAMGKRL